MEKNERETTTEVFLKWGSRKRLRCSRLRGHDEPSSHRIPRKISYSSHFLTPKDNLFPRLTRNSESGILRKSSSSGSPEKEEKSYTTRGGGGGGGCVEEISKVDCCEKKRVVWPKLYVSLSNKEKEEDFMAMKGCKLPQRPKKRAKLIQRTLLLVSPGAWLTDMSIERYEVREKKSSKKRPRGLKAMGSVDSDSE